MSVLVQGVINPSFSDRKKVQHVINAVVYVLTRYLESDTAVCAAYCAAMGYKIAAIVKDDYQAALHELCFPAVTVLVVAKPERLTEQCTPRTEIASLQSGPGPRGRRIETLRRNVAK